MAEKAIKITGLTAVQAQLRAVSDFLQSPAPMQHIVDDVKDLVLTKTALGLDYKGKSFEPYSAKYAKKKMGMTATGRPNLKVTGRMLDAVTAKVQDAGHGSVFIKDAAAAQIGQYHNAGTKKMAKREFMNISQSAVDKLAKKYFDDEIMKILGRR
jgi:hypothetical protein